MTLITHAKYKRKHSIVIENSSIRAEFVPSPGGKMVSFIQKDTGHEYLLQNQHDDYQEQPFGGSYGDGECSGFDDMFPTIDKCTYKKAPWEGAPMVDHGEVWSLPWEYTASGNTLSLSTRGVHFPYVLEKNVSFLKDNVLRISYTLTNTSVHPFSFLWAAHMMLTIVPGAKINVPPDCKQAITVLSSEGRGFGQLSQWPVFKDRDETSFGADTYREKKVGAYEKFYFANKLAEGWVELVYPKGISNLRIEFSSHTVPYLGIMNIEGGWDNMYCVIVEPCTVCFDRPDVAEQYGQLSTVEGKGQYTWYLDMCI